MRLPEKKRPGKPVLASDWNLLLDAIAARTPRPAPGMELVLSSGGFIYRVRPQAGFGSSSQCTPLEILPSRPSYIAAPPTPPAEGIKRYYIEWGTVNDIVAENWDDHFDLSSTTYFFADISLAASDQLKVASWEIVTGSSWDSHQTADWPVGSPRPASMVILLGHVYVDGDGRHHISPNGGGSIQLTEHITSIQPGGSGGEVQIGKQLSYNRLSY
ncbi:MAG: hypothetical protein H7A51_03995 [Akkermansiaceae bacterium]|nr:hypothetical protein [Akkermansiaceae bacterium]